METEAFLDATIEAKLNEKLYEIEAGIDAQIAAIEASEDYTQEEKDAMIAELNQAKELVEAVRVVRDETLLSCCVTDVLCCAE